MIPRAAQGTLRKLAKGYPVLLLTGPRQSGKTTLARATFPRKLQDLMTFQRFLRLCAARTGQSLNLANLAVDCGVAQGTARAWLSVLQASYLVFLLPPHYRNFGKRLVKSPKLYFHDTGLAANLIGIESPAHLAIRPERPALFETFVINEFLKRRFNAGLPSNLHFWRDNAGTEVDLVLEESASLLPVEVKSGRTVNDEFFSALRKWIAYAGKLGGAPALVYGGEESYVRSGIRVMSWRDL